MNAEFIVAIHALIYLNKHRGAISSETLADNICVASPRIRKVLSKLKEAKFIKVSYGKYGGYELNQDLEDIKLSDCMSVFNDKCVKAHWISGDISKNCDISSNMNYLVDDMVDDLNRICLNYLTNLTVYDLYKKILEKNK